MTVDIKNSSNSQLYRHDIEAKPLSPKIRLNPQETMVMFDLDGTLIREGVLLRKVLKHVCKPAIDKVMRISNDSERVTFSELLNSISATLENKIENVIAHHEPNNETLEKILSERLPHLCEETLLPEQSEAIMHLSEGKVASQYLANTIHKNLFQNKKVNQLLLEGIKLYKSQMHDGNEKEILPETINVLSTLAHLGTPVSIISNSTQSHVNKIFKMILEKLPQNVQDKWRDKEWYFSKLGIQRDGEGDLYQQAKPSADLLRASHSKATRFNNHSEKEKLSNVIFIGNSERFDMRAADNFQRSSYSTEKDLQIYKLLSRFDNPLKHVKNTSLVDNHAVTTTIDAVEERLQNVFSNGDLNVP